MVASTSTSLSVKVAIVGMDAFFGECNGLDAFEGSIYDGKQHFIPLPEQRWHGINEQEKLLQEYGLEAGKAPQGAYITDFEIDTLAYKIPPNEVEKLNPQQLLMLKVCDRALKDAKIQPNTNVAVIIAAETELSVHQLQQRWNSPWQVRDGLNAAEIALPPEKIAQLETIVKDSVHHQVEIGEYLSYVANIMASRVCSLWNFSGPSFSISAVENAAFKAIELAQMLLATNEVEAVLVGAVDLAGGVENVLLRSQWGKINTGINTLSFDQNANGWTVGEGAGAVVLKRHDIALENQERIYAVIDSLSIGQSPSMAVDSNTITEVCQQAFQQAGIQPVEVNYLEVCASGIPIQDEAEITGILQAYPGVGDGLHCAIGSVKANIGHTFVASGIASLIKTALSVYYKYIPATPSWSGVKTPQVWEGSPFYVATESRPWFLQKEAKCRIAAINSIGCDGTFAHLILSEETSQTERSSRYLQERPFHLFPITGDDQTSLFAALDNLQKTIETAESLTATASQNFVNYQQKSSAKYTISITGRNQKELLKEIESARKGVANAFATGKDWQTPTGSYFTPKPLGKAGEVAFVYPAAVNSYVGIGRMMFRLFPKTFNDEILQSLHRRVADVEKLIFPRSLSKLTTRHIETLEKKLLDDSLAMLEAEMHFTRLITTIIRDDFQVKPKYVFGYSLGETSMMVAQGVWSNFYQGSHSFNSSNLFGDRLSGNKNAVREYWGLPKISTATDNNLWANYVLMATPAQVRECLKTETRVYLTQINTPEEVLIAGEPTACERVIKKLGCNAFPAPFDHVIHAPAMQSECSELVRLNNLPAKPISGITFYSAAEYKPITIDSEIIAQNIAKGLCQELDFPRLVNRVYNDGAKIFIEAGAGGICSRWISKILGNQQHITVSLNRRGIDDHTSIVRVLAKLVSHRVNLDLSPLYNLSSETAKKNTAAMRKVTLGGKSIAKAILNPENSQIFSNNAHQNSHQREYKLINSLQLSVPILPSEIYPQSIPESQPKTEKITMKTIMDNGLNLPEKLESSKLNTAQKPANTKVAYLRTSRLNYRIIMNDLKTAQYQKLTNNNSKLTKAHTSFLQARQEFSQQMSEIIQLQLACAQNLLSEDK
ncbi:PfaB family protein [Richelia sinica FACHB-800]|uniref:PfaB family protein n=1 Tax=Richelia sinica FACHB-800 TaxID=1357546 RepID=A0A975T468_9NOST|nr:type I polyketide synthase [Richelia sinica]MBD2663049.1 type I polyketide synthase [Richelia sinica FACHB-800]QXE21906.1 PfaB family protein [Richelia sinica FACHB-800]